jgi:hypothetical protein
MAYAGTSGPSPIPNPPPFQVSTNTVTLCKGVINYVPITVSNLGDYNGATNITMNNVQVAIQNNKNLITIANGITNLLTVKAGSSATATLPIFVTLNASGILSSQIAMNYQYFDYYSDSETRNVTFDVISCSGSSQLQINVTPDVLISGQINYLMINFTNTGNTTLRNVSAQTVISSSQTGIQLLGKKQISIDSIEPKNTISIVQGIYENGSQIFPINITASFINGTLPVQMSDSFTMLSGGTIEMIPSSITSTPDPVSPGSIVSLSFVITNVGTSGVADASATAVTPNGFKPYGATNSDFIGSIGTETPTSVSLALVTNSSLKSGTYTIPVRLNYLDNFRRNLSTTVNVTVVVSGSTTSSGGNSGTGGTSNSSSGGSDTGLYILVGTFVVVIVLILLFPRLRRRKPVNPGPPGR